MYPWIIGIGIIVIILFILDYERYHYEGAHLGPRIQGWVYNWIAPHYDVIKQDSQAHDTDMLARPLIDILQGAPYNSTRVFLLDVATGTGRLPLALLHEPEFEGQIVALDISSKMLALAAHKLAPFRDRVSLLQQTAFSLPFPCNSFDVVSCIEALEIMPSMETPMAEIARVLRPGGLLLTTREKKGSRPVNLIVDSDTFQARLEAAGFEQIVESYWWEDYNIVMARAPGQLELAPTYELTDVLQCPHCQSVTLNRQSSSYALTCNQCNTELSTTADGTIVLRFAQPRRKVKLKTQAHPTDLRD